MQLYKTQDKTAWSLSLYSSKIKMVVFRLALKLKWPNGKIMLCYVMLSKSTVGCKTIRVLHVVPIRSFVFVSSTHPQDDVNDHEEFKIVDKALTSLRFSSGEKKDVWRLLAAILHSGQVRCILGCLTVSSIGLW